MPKLLSLIIFLTLQVSLNNNFYAASDDVIKSALTDITGIILTPDVTPPDTEVSV